MYTIDTETALIEQGLLAPPLTCFQFALDDGPVMVVVAGVDPVEEIARVILRSEHIVGQNIAYDLLVLATEYPDLLPDIHAALDEDRISCTIVREKLRLIAEGRLKGARLGLADLAAKYGGAKDADDPWRLRYGELRGVPFGDWPLAARQYAAHDVEATRLVYRAQGDPVPDEAPQVRAAFVMHCIGATGVHTDPAAVAEFEAAVNEQYDTDRIALQAAGLVRHNDTKDTKAAKGLMETTLAAQGFEPIRTDTGQISVNEEACLLSGSPILQAYQRYGSMRSLRTRLQGLKNGHDLPLNSRFDSLVETGRTSCSKGQYGYQLQNMRRLPGERECFVPSPFPKRARKWSCDECGNEWLSLSDDVCPNCGAEASGCVMPKNVFLACDYDSFEIVALSQVCRWTVGRSALGNAITAGLDPHLAMAANALGIEYQDAKARLEAGDEAIKDARQGSKIANFGYPGGMGAQSFRKYAKGYGMDLDLDQAEELKANWHATWPEMAAYFRWVDGGHHWHETTTKKGNRISKTRIVQLMTERVRGDVSYTVACNGFFQGLAADAAKAAGWALLKACAPGGSLHGWNIWNFIHDEYILEGPEADGHRAAGVVKEIMESAAQVYMPDVPVTASGALMRRWSKKAGAVHDEKGRLIPWG